MVIIIRNAQVYQPEYAGKKDLLILGDQIAALGENLQAEFNGAVSVTEIDGTGMVLTPGFIDSHEHIMGGGGEGGFSTRTPEAVLTDLTMNGITTVVGCIGTDGITRDMAALLAKAHGLEEEGVTTYVYTGSYQVPVHTLTGSVMKDVMLLDKVIGAGEIAISDHRSSQPTFEEFVRIVSDVRVGGMLAGKAGIVNIHLGDSPRLMDLIWRTVRETEIPYTQFLPTHVNRNEALFQSAAEFAKAGGVIDFTGNEDIDYWESICDEVRVCSGIRRLLESGVSENNFTISSDGQGSLPVFNSKGEYQGIGIGKASCLLKEVRECVEREDIPLETALRAVTANPARILKLGKKGRLQPGCDADLCLLTEDGLKLYTVIAKGKIMVQEGKPVVRGTFEK
ncbi:MAG TPA: beta-aspartyl-peptidase [Candidatus Caccovicinus merdipullorum]|uniref:Isoaspartyl dipeptidase n=1 Tax=Candidatus Caccovicinus merdipullorum TaxID=2840724 RepID=A0A9D1GIC6_9FIRM|nr:beta-aspartyl-peptidase [Candidatus Caccovicinus merdipullorum]